MQKLGNLTDILENIAHHLQGDNQTLSNLMRVDTKIYKNRLILIREMVLNRDQSIKAYEKKPFGWNQVHTLRLNECQNITDVSAFGHVHALDLTCCDNITTNLSKLNRVKNIILPNGRKIKRRFKKKVC